MHCPHGRAFSAALSRSTNGERGCSPRWGIKEGGASRVVKTGQLPVGILPTRASPHTLISCFREIEQTLQENCRRRNGGDTALAAARADAADHVYGGGGILQHRRQRLQRRCRRGLYRLAGYLHVLRRHHRRHGDGPDGRVGWHVRHHHRQRWDDNHEDRRHPLGRPWVLRWCRSRGWRHTGLVWIRR